MARLKTIFRPKKRPMTDQEAEAEKRRFQRTTGVEWDWYRAVGLVRFTAIARTDGLASDEAGQKLIPYLTTKFQLIDQIWNASDLSWEEIVKGVSSLYQGPEKDDFEFTLNRFDAIISLRILKN